MPLFGMQPETLPLVPGLQFVLSGSSPYFSIKCQMTELQTKGGDHYARDVLSTIQLEKRLRLSELVREPGTTGGPERPYGAFPSFSTIRSPVKQGHTRSLLTRPGPRVLVVGTAVGATLRHDQPTTEVGSQMGLQRAPHDKTGPHQLLPDSFSKKQERKTSGLATRQGSLQSYK